MCGRGLWLVIKIKSCDRNKESDTAVFCFFFNCLHWQLISTRTGTDFNSANFSRLRLRLSSYIRKIQVQVQYASYRAGFQLV